MSDNPEPDPFESEEYQRFVESMVPHCHCASSIRPCAGVLAGGICDRIKDEREPDSDVDDAEDARLEQWGDGGLIELDST